jgi:hypothetical protein
VYVIRRNLINSCAKLKLELLFNSEKVKDFEPDERAKKLRGFSSCFFFECEHFGED